MRISDWSSDVCSSDLTLKAFDLGVPVVAAEIYLDFIPLKRSGIGHMRAAYAPPPLQAVKRDFAFLLPTEARADTLLRAVRGADKQVIAGVSLFAVFPGQGVPEGRKWVPVEVVLQPAIGSASCRERV